MNEIKKCSICGKNIDIIYKIPFCGLIGMKDYYEEKIGYCSNCSFLFNANPFSGDDLEKRYKYLSKYEFDEEKINFIEKQDYVIRSNIQKHFIEENCKEKINSVFEIGAASGYNLSLYKKEGKKVFGIEPSNYNKETSKKNYDIEIYADTFQNYLKEEKVQDKFDLIFLSHILEHIVNPMEFIEKVKKFANKYIFIDVPTFDYKFSDENFGMFSDEHVNYFTFASLQNLMYKSGFHLINARIEFYLNCYVAAGTPAIMTLWKIDDENIKYEKKKIIDNTIDNVRRYIEDSENILNEIRKKIDEIKDDEKLAIWGAGNHTSRLLAMTNLKNKNIVRIYDSDVKKQGKEILNIKISNFKKEDIELGIVDKIIISSYSSEKAICNSIENIIPKNKIIKLYNL